MVNFELIFLMLIQLELFFRRFFPKRLKGYRFYLKHLNGLSGLEIGGPSGVFDSKGLLPIYNVIKKLDGVNFSTNTIWEGALKEGNNYQFGGKIGFQYIFDSVDLSAIDSERYDCLLSCHSLEHIANPIKALYEWKRVVKQNGYLLFVIPHKDKTFDHKRTVTTLQHIISDFEQKVTEEDSTHFEEVIHLHDLSQDVGKESKMEFAERVRNNFNNRSLHHHVFNARLTVELLTYLNLEILEAELCSHHIVVLTKKSSNLINNQYYLSSDCRLYQNSDYPSDFHTDN